MSDSIVMDDDDFSSRRLEVDEPSDIVVARFYAGRLARSAGGTALEVARFVALVSEVARAVYKLAESPELELRVSEFHLEVHSDGDWDAVKRELVSVEGLQPHWLDQGVAVSAKRLSPFALPRVEDDALELDAMLTRRRQRLETVERLRDSRQALRIAQAELRRSNSDLERFATAIAHDLKQPLGAIGLFVALAKRHDAAADPTMRTYLDTIGASAQTTQAMLESLLKWSRVRAPDEAPVSAVAHSVNVALRNVAAQIREAQATVEMDCTTSAAVATIHLVEIVQNLISNALKYRSERPPHITVSDRVVGRDIVLTVSDNGIGIAADRTQRIFGLFRQLDASVDGSGVGLALVARYCERYDGSVTVQSELGVGSAFTVRLPHG